MHGEAFIVFGIAASAGGLEALKVIVAALPDNFPACVLVVRHRTTDSVDLLPEILQAKTGLKVKQAEEGDVLSPATVYTARPGWHLLVGPNDTLRLSDAPKVKHVRPAGDLLFKSMAASLGGRAVAVVLTGYDGDGSGGLAEVREQGGRVIVQHPDTAQEPGMPLSALATEEVDQVVPLDRIANAMIAVA
jgi:two-component system, chemotaxis family, protein-glutamate methylesterase/glutaminase